MSAHEQRSNLKSSGKENPTQAADAFLSGGGEMGARMRALNWSTTPLGPIESWPQSLRTAISLMLASRFAMVIAWGPDFRFFYNDRYRPVLGASKHPGALGTPAREIFPEAWSQIGPLFESTRHGDSVGLDDLLVPLDRYGYLENCYFTLSYSPIRDESGGVGGMLAVVAETTERVQGERRLKTLRDLARRASEAKTATQACVNAGETLGDNPIDAPFALLYLIEQDGAVAKLECSSGLTAGTAASPTVVDLTCADTAGWPLTSLVEDGAVKVLNDLPSRFGALPGGPYQEPSHTALLVPLLRPGQPRPDGILIFGISPRRALDDQYRAFIELAGDHILTAIRNALAYQEERERAERLAEIDRAKTIFFSNVSHEFRTPLTLILGPLETALSSALDPQQKEELEVVLRNGRRLQKLVNTLLDFSRIEAGRIQATYEATDLAAYTSELASMFRSAVERVGMEFIVDCAPLAEPIYVDREMWEKIILNLLSNAFKFTLKGMISVSLRPAGNKVELVVSDTGSGIAENELPHLFERFHRIRGAQARTHEGTGIGLALVRELVSLHGGTIDVKSEVGIGTTFTVALPTGSSHLPADRIGAPRTLTSTTLDAQVYVDEVLRWMPEPSRDFERVAEIDSASASSRLATDIPARILLADDNADMRKYLRRILERHWTVEVVPDGQSALDSARQRVPDLLLSDVMMPGLDGFELLRELRSDPLTRGIPVILLSARAGEESRIEGLEAGADDYLVKPFSSRELLARVAAHLQLARLRTETQEQISNILESIRDGFISLDHDWRYAYINAEAQRMGYRGELLGQQLWQSFPEIIGTHVETALRRAMDERVPVHFEAYSARRARTFANSAYPTADGGLTIYFQDISERKQAEERIASDLEAMTRLHEVGNLCVAAGNKFEECLDEIVSAAIALMGADEGNLQLLDPVSGALTIAAQRGFAEPFLEFFSSVANDSNACGVAMRSATRVIVEDVTQHELFNTQPSLRILLEAGVRAFQSTPLISSAGILLGLISTHFREPRKLSERELRLMDLLARQTADYLERKHADEALKASQSQLQTLFNKTPQGVYLVGDDFRIRRVNPTAIPAFGNIPDLIGRDFNEVIHILWPKAYADEMVALFRRTLETGEPHVTPERIEQRLDTGETEYYEWQINRIPLPEGGYGVVCYFRDISTQVFIRQERERLLVAEHKAREAADAASRAKDEFLATVSHELRNPLNAMLGWARLLSAGTLDEATAARGLKSIEQNARAQAQLIEDLLDVSRIISGNFRLNVEQIQIVRVIEAAIESVRPAADAKQITLSAALDPDAGPVSADSGRVQQVVWNLLSNAVKFTPKGGSVSVQLTRLDSQIQIVVSDTGEGIAPEFLPCVFDRFRQADGSSTRLHGGLGLGLAIVRHIAELHGGSVAAESAGKGLGATFIVKLPTVAAHARPIDQHRFIVTGAETGLDFTPSLSLKGVSVLVVDDQPETLLLLSNVLTQSGASVKTASSAAEGFREVKLWRPDIIVSDIEMPEEDGYSFMKRVRTWSREAGYWIPAVALTAYARAEDRMKVLASGFQIHVSKPVEPAELVTVIGSLIEGTATVWSNTSRVNQAEQANGGTQLKAKVADDPASIPNS